MLSFVRLFLVALLCCASVTGLDGPPHTLVASSIPFQYQHAATPSRPIGSFIQVCLLIGGVAFTLSSAIVGPLMGITSVLWLMMRNDSAIDPRLSWMVFGAWFIFTMLYFLFQCRRVYNHQLYIFLSIALACICMGAVALVQRASLQSGLVTVIPPCASFAAYSVAYFFPDWRQERITMLV